MNTSGNNWKERRTTIGRIAANVGAALAAVAVLCSAVHVPVAEAIAVTGVVTDFGTRIALRLVP